MYFAFTFIFETSHGLIHFLLVQSVSNSTGSTSKSVKKKCILLACNNSGERVAEGRVFSTNPPDTVHHAPLGPNASKVLVEVVHVGNAKVWRATSEFQTIADALGSILAWPNDKLMYALTLTW